jgi:hypothetical protein
MMILVEHLVVLLGILLGILVLRVVHLWLDKPFE